MREWRTTITTGTGPSTLRGVAPVCPHQNDPARHLGGEAAIYDCCPQPQMETGDYAQASVVVSLLNAGEHVYANAARALDLGGIGPATAYHLGALHYQSQVDAAAATLDRAATAVQRLARLYPTWTADALTVWLQERAAESRALL